MHDKVTINFNLSQPKDVYILGYFWADCYFGFNKIKNIYEFSFEISQKDFLEIWDILKDVGFKKYSSRTRKNSKNPLSNVRAARRADMDFFKKWGFDKKISGCPLYFNLPENMKNYFIKGFLDGDGTVSLDKNGIFRICFYGLHDQSWSFLEDFCKKNNIKYKIYKKNRKQCHPSHTKDHKYSIFEFTNNQDRVDFFKTLPKDDFGLKRKTEAFYKFKQERMKKENGSKFCKKIYF